MTYDIALFVDDERFPPEKGNWIIIRSYEECIFYLKKHDCPKKISFDHDLGGLPGTDGIDIVNWMMRRI